MYSGKIAVPPGGGGIVVTKVKKHFNLQLTLTGVGETGPKYFL
jgi:fructose-1-phosphate kinase PfkB-like protein